MKKLNLLLKTVLLTTFIITGFKSLMSNSPETTKTETGLIYKDHVIGSGNSPEIGKKVTVHYTGKLLDGTIFDSSVERKQPFSFTIGIGQVISGWDEGVMTMKVGGKRTLTIPANLAYGSRGAGKLIPPDSTLEFDVELLAVA
jgi:peptidylprolyl isomerase